MQRENPELRIEQEKLRNENTLLGKKLHDLESRNAALEDSLISLNMAVEATGAGFWYWNIKTGTLNVNKEWAAIIGYTIAELEPLTFNSWLELCHPEDRNKATDLLERYFREETDTYELELRMRHKLGHWVWVLDIGKVFERNAEGEPVRMGGSHQNITTRKEAELALAKSLTFERLVTTLSNQFINLPYEQIDGMINSTLELIGTFVQTDRSYIFQFCDNLRLMDNTHEWCSEGTEPQIDTLKGLPTSIFPWWMERINNNEIIHIPRITEMPEEAAAKKRSLSRRISNR